MKVNEYIRRCILRNPKFYKNRGDVLLRVFTADNISWQGGGFEDLANSDIDEFDAMNNLFRDSLTFQVKFRSTDPKKAEKERYDNFQRISSEIISCLDILKNINQNISDFNPSQSVIVLNENSNIFNIPDKIYSDWKDALKETYLYLQKNLDKLTEDSKNILKKNEKNIHQRIF